VEEKGRDEGGSVKLETCDVGRKKRNDGPTVVGGPGGGEPVEDFFGYRGGTKFGAQSRFPQAACEQRGGGSWEGV